MRKWLSWSGRDQGALEAVLGAALLIVVVFGLVLPAARVVGVGTGSSVRVVELEEPASVPELPAGAGVTLLGTSEAELSFFDPDARERFLLELPVLLVAALAALVIVLLLRIARTLREGDPFVPANARRLTVIALTVLAGAVLVPLSFAITTDLLQQDTAAEDVVAFSASLSALPILVGLLIAALAEFFRRGTKLREDTEGLV
jgi:hypothetical protein